MTELVLSCGIVALLDEEDLERAKRFTWFFHEKTGYVMGYTSSGRGRMPIYLHRWILDAPKGAYVDHANKVKTDNRRVNIRVCSQRENLFNGDMARRKQTSKYRGVSASRHQWRARVGNLTLGYFNSEESAAAAYDASAYKAAPAFAQLNFRTEK